jgi:asparagine synthase (glutamine-hydrolysing)
VSRLARPYVTVALTGDGGDEAFGGYTLFQGQAFSETYQRLPGVLQHSLVPALVGTAARFAPPRLAASALRSQRVVRDAQLGLLERTYRKLSYFDEDERRGLLADPVSASRRLLGDVDARANPQSTPLERVGFLMSRFYLPNDMLTKVDRMSMAHSLEARGPFLDHRLAEWAAGVPDHMKLRGRQGKYILRKIAAEYVPPHIARRPKRGFEAPLGAWLKHGFEHYARSVLFETGSAASRWFQRAALERAVSADVLRSGGARATERLWILLSFECWHRMYFDNTFGKF